MGKRKRSRDRDYEEICKKVKKLGRKLRKYRTSESSTDRDDRRRGEDSPITYRSYYDPDIDYTDKEASQDEVVLNKEAPQKEVAQEKIRPEDTATNQALITSEESEVLDPEILNILGDDPTTQKEYGDDLHKDIAARWTHILSNGLAKDTKSDLMKEYLPARNCANMQAPKLNLEIEAALSPVNIKKDLYSRSKQSELSSCLAAVGNVLNWALSSNIPQTIIKPLSDAGRLLCDCHYRESQSRRYAIVNTLNKQTRDAVKNTKIDEFLFGAGLADHLKSSKAITRSGSEMRSAVQRVSSKPPPPTAPSHRGALNARGAPRAAFDPRQNPNPRRQAPLPPPPPARDRRQEYPPSRRNNARRGAKRY